MDVVTLAMCKPVLLDFTEYDAIKNGRAIADTSLYGIVDNALKNGRSIHVTASFEFDVDGSPLTLPPGLHGIVSGYQRYNDEIYLTASCTFPLIQKGYFVQAHFAIVVTAGGCQFMTQLGIPT